MRMVEDDTGRFPGRPVFSRREIDETCERIVAELLKERHGAVGYPVLTDDLTVLIERDTEDLDLFADLSTCDEAVEGVTIFRPGRKPMVKISGKLTQDPNRTNRLRSTLAHEYAHVLLHAFLWEDNFPKPAMLRGIDWMEWQADYAAGALLMPRSALTDKVQEHRGHRTSPVLPQAENSFRKSMIEAVRRGFGVSRAAARVRLERQGHLARDTNPRP